jgi:WD40 repeat protein
MLVDLFSGNEAEVQAVVFSPDGRWLFTAGGDNSVRVWGRGDRRSAFRLDGHEDRVLALAISRDGRTLMSAGRDKAVRAYDVSALYDRAPAVRWFDTPIRTVALDAEGGRVACEVGGGSVHAYDLVSGKPLDPEAAALLVQESARARQKDAETFSSRLSLTGDGAQVFAVAPGKERVAVGGADKLVRVLDAASGEEVARFTGHGGAITALCFLRGSSLLASASLDKTIRVHSVEDRRDIALLEGHTDQVGALACSDKGGYIASGSTDRSLRIWDLSDLETPSAELSRRARRDFGLRLRGSRIVATHQRAYNDNRD